MANSKGAQLFTFKYVKLGNLACLVGLNKKFDQTQFPGHGPFSALGIAATLSSLADLASKVIAGLYKYYDDVKTLPLDRRNCVTSWVYSSVFSRRWSMV